VSIMLGLGAVLHRSAQATSEVFQRVSLILARLDLLDFGII
jgi:hypothetical protein